MNYLRFVRYVLAYGVSDHTVLKRERVEWLGPRKAALHFDGGVVVVKEYSKGAVNTRIYKETKEFVA